MAGETTPTRVETVTASIAAIAGKYGADDKSHMTVQCLKDISMSLAMLVDKNTTESASSASTAESTD